MKRPHRRHFLHLAAGAVALPAISRGAKAQTYPSRPVRIVVPIAAGGGLDITTRLMGQWLSERLGQQFVVENRPGGGSNIGTETVVRATADGYTLLAVAITNAVNAALYDKLNYNFIRDIAPVAGTVRVSNVAYVHPSVPVRTIAELVAYAKANPGKINMASAGNGTSSHMAGELFKMMAGVDMVHVPYRGQGAALPDLLGGQVQLMFATTPGTTEYAVTGKLRALAVTTATRAEALPDAPTVAESLQGYESSNWYGIGAPANTPAEIIDRLNKEINAGLTDSKLRARLADLGAAVMPGTPVDFGRLIADETEKWGKVIRAANIKPE